MYIYNLSYKLDILMAQNIFFGWFSTCLDCWMHVCCYGVKCWPIIVGFLSEHNNGPIFWSKQTETVFCLDNFKLSSNFLMFSGSGDTHTHTHTHTHTPTFFMLFFKKKCVDMTSRIIWVRSNSTSKAISRGENCPTLKRTTLDMF